MRNSILQFCIWGLVGGIVSVGEAGAQLANQPIKIGMSSHIQRVKVRSSAGVSSDPTGMRTLTSVGMMPNHTAASRFLSQASLGASMASIEQVRTMGIEPWLDQQLNMAPSFSIQGYLQALHQSMVDSLKLKNPSGTYTLENVGVDDIHFDISWFQGSMVAPDVLRWKVALALSEIFVVSRISSFGENPYALASYYDVLLNNSFSNYRTLLERITYHPSMGVYLTYMSNRATDASRNIFPDENYAREVMQLFSIGLFRLNLDGTEQRDANNQPIPTYNNDDIAGLAKVFTGLSWGDARYLGEGPLNRMSYTLPMKFFALDNSDSFRNPWRNPPRVYNAHEPGTKTFLGYTVPSRPLDQGNQDIQEAIDVLSNHPNVGPFVCRRLIQRLVTSNPTPAYIARTASVFNNNGSGVRGDLKAVVRAILLDPEARDCCGDQTSNTSGALREPFVRYMNLVKGLNLTAPGGIYRNVMYSLHQRLEQKPLYSPSVFNFFQPDYIPDGPMKLARKFGPEFQMLNSQTLTNYQNALHQWLINDDPIEYWGLFTNETYKPAQEPRFDLAADNVLTSNKRLPELLDKYNLILTGGKLTPTTLQTIRNAVEAMPYTESNGVPNTDNAYRRMRIAIMLIMSSPDYLINR
jgi:uncharacterized protein (DUF1800 family)